MKVGICAIIKDCRAPYLNEWLNWHRLIGVDVFYIYDNDSIIPLSTVVENMTGVFIQKWQGKNQQHLVYADCIKNKKECDWIAFIDDDEFIVIEKGNINNIK